MPSSRQPQRSILKDCGYIVLPTVFFIHFTATGTAVLIYTLVMHRPTPTKYTIGAAITFAIILSMLAAIHLFLYCRQRFSKAYAAEKGSISGSSGTDYSESRLLTRLRNFLKRHSRNSLAFLWYREKGSDSEQKRKKAGEKGNFVKAKDFWRQSDTLEPDSNPELSGRIIRKSQDHGHRGQADKERLQQQGENNWIPASMQRVPLAPDSVIVVTENYQTQKQTYDMESNLGAPATHNQAASAIRAVPPQAYYHAAPGGEQVPPNGAEARQNLLDQRSHNDRFQTPNRSIFRAGTASGDMIPIRHPSPQTRAPVTRQRGGAEQPRRLTAPSRIAGRYQASPQSHIRFHKQNNGEVQSHRPGRQALEHYQAALPLALAPANLLRQEVPHRMQRIDSDAPSSAPSPATHHATDQAYRLPEQRLPRRQLSSPGPDEELHGVQSLTVTKNELRRKPTMGSAGTCMEGFQQRQQQQEEEPPMLDNHMPYRPGIHHRTDDHPISNTLEIMTNDNEAARTPRSQIKLTPTISPFGVLAGPLKLEALGSKQEGVRRDRLPASIVERGKLIV
ncbi:hypothetical protein BP5796_00918 [Coleophoma crateriformis]|uniref:Uncharacterized protein n=1 Tax=Coleophoma crateriformis TaxID=565419 RepID=A0A3D8T9E4_9HELO|nr:hypothetical protein BP5796_00918 [Coleophoma crateriformis]